MQTKNLNRSVRRHNRARQIQHAFNIYWHGWYGVSADETYDYNKWWHDKVLLEDNAARFAHQDEHRAKALEVATKNAKHLRNCSCFMCSGYKKYEKTPKQLREIAKDAEELEEVLGEGVAFNATI